MSPRSRASASLPPRSLWQSTAACLALVLGACSPLPTASSTSGELAAGLGAASSGVCGAIVALPDLAAAERAFTNLAHDPLHRLAADARLDRSTAARTLEGMQRIEIDFRAASDVATMTRDLSTLLASADTGLEALGLEVPPCPR